MIAVDTNILIYAHRGETELHEAAASRLVDLSEGAERWALPVFCVTEFLRVQRLDWCRVSEVHSQTVEPVRRPSG